MTCTNTLEVYGEPVSVTAFMEDLGSAGSLGEFLKSFDEDLESAEVDVDCSKVVEGSETELTNRSFYWESAEHPSFHLPALISARYPRLSIRFIYENLNRRLAGSQYYQDSVLDAEDVVDFDTILGTLIEEGLFFLQVGEELTGCCALVPSVVCMKIAEDDADTTITRSYRATLSTSFHSDFRIRLSCHGAFLGYEYDELTTADWLRKPVS